MDFIIFPPPEELKEFISHFWVLRQNASPQKSPVYFLTASSLTDFTFFFSNDNTNTSLLASTVQGLTDRGQQIPADPSVNIFGVSIFPYAFPMLFGIPAHDITNRSIPIQDLLGKESKDILEKIMLASTDEAKINLLSKFFSSALTNMKIPDLRIIQALKEINKLNGNLNIKKLSAHICISERQLERQFIVHVGLPPKLYARIVRFETALNSPLHNESLTETAYKNGYYDQAHFIREFRAFSDLTPSEYFSLLNS